MPAFRKAIRCWERVACRSPSMASRWQTHGSSSPMASRICRRDSCPIVWSNTVTRSIDDIFAIMNVLYPMNFPAWVRSVISAVARCHIKFPVKLSNGDKNIRGYLDFYEDDDYILRGKRHHSGFHRVGSDTREFCHIPRLGLLPVTDVGPVASAGSFDNQVEIDRFVEFGVISHLIF